MVHHALALHAKIVNVITETGSHRRGLFCVFLRLRLIGAR
jgi:hypothetical protein